MANLPKWLVTTLAVVSAVLHVLGGAGIIPPVVRLSSSSVQPMIGTNPSPTVPGTVTK